MLAAQRHLHHHIIKASESIPLLVLWNMAGGRLGESGEVRRQIRFAAGEGLDWLIVDEASRLKPDIRQAYLFQRRIDKQGWALLISTPKSTRMVT